jgi:hypothetical protein
VLVALLIAAAAFRFPELFLRKTTTAPEPG